MLGDDLAAELPGLQTQAESTMRTPCRVKRPTGVGADPNTGADVYTYATSPVYVSDADGRPGCKVKYRNGEVALLESADSSVTIQRYEVHFPVGAGPFKVGDVVQTPGQTFRVTGLHYQTFQTAQRLPVEELS